ncbi:MAG: 50S ribosomal protein L21 [Phycisphaerales bacterium]|nr:50S ribosomal protein L21 [Phycisphaerales bacterium]
MYAIIEESGGQRKVNEGDEILVDLYQSGEAEAGSTINYDKVLVVGDESVAGKAKIGRPYVDGAVVAAQIIDPMVKGEKINIYKFKPKKGYKRKTGHRQRYTAVKITSIKA